MVTSQARWVSTPPGSLPWSEASLKELLATAPEALPLIMGERAGFHPNAGSPE